MIPPLLLLLLPQLSSSSRHTSRTLRQQQVRAAAGARQPDRRAVVVQGSVERPARGAAPEHRSDVSALEGLGEVRVGPQSLGHRWGAGRAQGGGGEESEQRDSSRSTQAAVGN